MRKLIQEIHNGKNIKENLNTQKKEFIFSQKYHFLTGLIFFTAFFQTTKPPAKILSYVRGILFHWIKSLCEQQT